MSQAVKRLIEQMSEYPTYQVLAENVDTMRRCGLIRLDRNENLFLPESFVRSVVENAMRDTDLRLYANCTSLSSLMNELSDYVGVPPDCLVIGAGSDDLIRLVTQAVLQRGERAVIIEPTFAMYSLCTVRAGGTPVTVQLRPDLSMDTDSVLEVASDAQIVFLCSPNNPTGNQFDTESVLRVVENSPGIVILDEAYVEFADRSLSHLPLDYDNVIVLRTLSKAFALASLRIGYCIAAEPVATSLRERFQLPYPVSSLAMAVAQRMLKRRRVVLESCALVKRVRQQMLSLLQDIHGVRVFDSQANFILVSFEIPSSRIARRMAGRGYILREIGTACGYQNLVRITVPPLETMESLIVALREVIES